MEEVQESQSVGVENPVMESLDTEINVETAAELELSVIPENSVYKEEREEDANLEELHKKLYLTTNQKVIKNLHQNLKKLIDVAKQTETVVQSRRLRQKYSEKQKLYQSCIQELIKQPKGRKPSKKCKAKVKKQLNQKTTESLTKVNKPEEDCTVEEEDWGNLYETESEDSDGLQEFFDAVEPKKRKRKPRQKIQLTKEEQEAKEKENLQKRTCKICDKVFSIPKGLQNHTRVKHTFEKPYTCDICDERFAIQSSYALHRRRHLGIKPHLCNVCGKNFLRHIDLARHMKRHDKIRNIMCHLCSNAYSSIISLRKHMLIKHTDPSEWKHQCQICDKKCVSTTSLNLHVKQHNQDRSFKCHICGKGFYTKQNMQIHVRTHSADTKFNCKHCSNGYRSNEALQRHQLKVHGIGVEKLPSFPKYFCPVCNNGFVQKARFEKHLRLHETGEEEYPFKCDPCVRQYKDRNFFALHMKNKHDVVIDDDCFNMHGCTSESEFTYSYSSVALQEDNSD